ncbi:L,D-transpeptidase [Novipirellula sp. SH528]|uniref:L,D-transpeptidase n=1 Tax=Novipirellula sp. SH528 TaxID=3454466 RepID=UPI003FA0FF53
MHAGFRVVLGMVVGLPLGSQLLAEETYIKKINVDLSTQLVTIEWTGPNAVGKEEGPFHCSPGRGKGNVDCDDVETSKKKGTECTPKGTFKVLGKDRRFSTSPRAEWVVRFQSKERGIALHYWPTVPKYPASHGCVRLAKKDAAKLIYDNSTIDVTVVNVSGTLRTAPNH